MKHNIKIQHLLLLFLISVALGQAYAAVRQYQTDIDHSLWQLTTNTPINCALSHDIEGYGEAQFHSTASKNQNLLFTLDMLKLPANYDIASVKSIAPHWRPGIATKNIADMKLLKQFDGELPQYSAWLMLSELEKGMLPTFYYNDWHSPYDKIAVQLNSANFHPAYRDFLKCQANLLPFSFDDIAYTVLNYKKNSDQLTKSARKRLAMIGQYLTAAPDLEFGLVTAFTDSHGGRWHNQQLSEKRAEKIKSFLTEKGVAADKITIQGLGEKRHIASNQNILDRAKNRRVVIQLEGL
jgi:outer membrane protein OmpA-like peptidoglycan-associated protein